ncbi:MAG: hypothetical protein ACKPBV_21085, partial [Sphaerospermopsis kisseleviana]
IKQPFSHWLPPSLRTEKDDSKDRVISHATGRPSNLLYHKWCGLAGLRCMNRISGHPNAAITWPQAVLGDEHILAVVAQVYGNVREWQECPVPEVVTLAQKPLLLHLRKPSR